MLVGGALRNVYRRQAGTPGLVAVGDSVATTTPTRGRGIAMACMQVTALLALLDEGADPATVAEPFGAWCDHAIEPWVADHIAIDGGMVRRWQGEDLDLSIPLTSDLIAAAVEADPRIGQHAGGYFAMTALPETLRPAEPWHGRSTRTAGDRRTHPAQRATNWWTSSARLCPPPDRRPGGVQVDVPQHHPCALGDEGGRDGQADSLRATSDHRGAVLEQHPWTG